MRYMQDLIMNNPISSIVKADGEHEFACVQGQKTLMGRGDIIKETTLEIFNTKDAEIWNEKPVVSLDHEEVKTTSVEVYGVHLIVLLGITLTFLLI